MPGPSRPIPPAPKQFLAMVGAAHAPPVGCGPVAAMPLQLAMGRTWPTASSSAMGGDALQPPPAARSPSGQHAHRPAITCHKRQTP